MNDPILITGAARSGTSMVAGAINLCNAFGGKMSGPNQHNAKGMFENSHIRDQLVKPYLRGLGVDPKGQYPLPDVNNLPMPRQWREQVENVMKAEGYKEGKWMYKGAKMCLFWPVWHAAFPNAKWVIVRRRTGGIVRSCMRTGFMNAFSNTAKQRAVGASSEEDGWKWWVRQHEQRFVEMIQEGMNVKVVWPHRMIAGDYSQLKETIEWLGLEWNPKVMEFIEPKLYNSRKKGINM